MQPHKIVDDQTSEREPIALPEPTWMPERIRLNPLPQECAGRIGDYLASQPVVEAVYRAFVVAETPPHSDLRRLDVLTAECKLSQRYSCSRGELLVVHDGESYVGAHAGFSVRRSDRVVGRVEMFSRTTPYEPLGLPSMGADPEGSATAEERERALDTAGLGRRAEKQLQLDVPWRQVVRSQGAA
jgi:hypothetical protein